MSALSAATEQVIFAPPSATRVLSPDVIATRVQQRVKERDGWIVGETIPSTKDIAKLMCKHFPEIVFPPVPSQQTLDEVFPVQPVDFKKIHNPPSDDIQATWLGHSTLLVQMGCNILTDPVFSDRCSPSRWFGPKRYRPPACQIQDLVDQHVDIHVVLLSHNHYDHLDYTSVQDLATKLSNDVTFVVPLGLRDWLIRKIPETCNNGNQIIELDWHESIVLKPSLKVTAVPMRHWGSRSAGDRDKTLWCGYSCSTTTGASKECKFLFPGDTAWFDGLKTIVGDCYGPFDLAAIPIGAYEPREFMKVSHINPHEAVQMMEAVRASKAVPIHWGTFPLGIDQVEETRDLLEKCMEGKDKSTFAPWFIGDTVVTMSQMSAKDA